MNYNSINFPVLLVAIIALSIACDFSFAQMNLQDDRISNNLKVVGNNIDFSYDCLIQDPFAQLAFATHKGEVAAVQMAPGEIASGEENEYGEELYQELLKENTFVTSGPQLQALQKMTNDLLQCRKEKSGMQYKVFLIGDSTVNAFTAGGYIFVYTGIIDYCKTTSELACIMAHEIGHNEKGHINLIMKRLKIAGQFGDLLMLAKQLTSASFNQFNELEADCYGADLAYAAGYNPMVGANLWKRMADDNAENPNLLGKFFRTHPFSMDRYGCLKDHITKNYNLNF